VENNCVTIKNFEVPGCIYYPGTELNLGAALLEDWVRRGFVKLLVAEPEEQKPKKQSRKRHSVKANTAVTI